MKIRIAVLIGVLAMIAAACGAPPTEVGQSEPEPATETSTTETSTTEAPATTTTTEAPATTTTTSAPATTTTEAPATTTTIEGAVDDLEVLQAAFERSAAITTGRMEGYIEMSGLDPSAGFTEIAIPFGGAFDNDSGNYSFYMDMSGLAEAAGDELPPEFADLIGEMEVRQIGDTAYMRFAFFNMFLGADTDWISMPAEDGTAATEGFAMTSPTNPAEILGSFEDAGATVEVIGTEEVNGVTATHYRAVFDTEALLAQATPEERARLEAQGPLPADFLPMDVWISDDGLVVRFLMEIDGTDLATTPEESFERMVMRYDLFDLGKGVVIEPPPSSDVTDIEDLAPDLGL